MPGQRRRTDRDPRPRARAPDDARHAARGARHRRHHALLERIESGDVLVHCVDTTEPSVLAHEILTARPYAYLDDEGEIQNRRTNAVVLRRGLSVDLASIGALDPAAIEQVTAEITPEPTTADELHDLLCSLVVLPARDDWRALWDELVAKGRGTFVEPPAGAIDDGASCGARPSPPTTPARTRRRRRGRRRAPPRPSRGHRHHDSRRAGRVHASDRRTRRLWARGPRAGGIRLPRPLHSRRAPATEWVARRLLARMHAGSRRRRRSSIQPATAQDFMRFLLRWQHVAPDTQLAGESGLAAIVEQLEGFEAAAVGVGTGGVRRGDYATTARVGSTGCATTARSPGCV